MASDSVAMEEELNQALAANTELQQKLTEQEEINRKLTESFGEQLAEIQATTQAELTAMAEQGRWVQEGGKKKYLESNGQYVSGDWREIGDGVYYFDQDGYMVADDWQGDSYFDADGKMVRNTWVDQYYLEDNGRQNMDYVYVEDGEWKKDRVGYRFYNEDGSYYTNTWRWIDGNNDGVAESYYFANNGYMVSGRKVDGYQLNSDGQWVKDGEIQTRIAVRDNTTKPE